MTPPPSITADRDLRHELPRSAIERGTALPESLRAAVAAVEAAAAAGDPVAELRARSEMCTLRFRRGEHASVIDEAPRLADQLARAGMEAERREALYQLSMSANERARFDVALDAANLLVDLSSEPGPALRAALALGACLERMGDSWQGERVLADALAGPAQAAPARDRLVALNGLAAFAIGSYHRMRGIVPTEELNAVLERGRRCGEQALELLVGIEDPPYEVAVHGNLGEILVGLGELDRGEALLGHALDRAAQAGLPAHGWRVTASVGELLLARDLPAEALARMLALLAGIGPQARVQTLIRARHVAYRACRALGDFAAALDHFEQVEALERQAMTSQLRAQSQFFVTRTEVEQARRDAQRHLARANEMAQQIERDPLTGLGNRAHLARRGSELLRDAEREQSPLALLLLDVDHFKSINDGFGHGAGDAVLVELASLLRENTRGQDVLVRLGGEEFVLLMPGLDLAHGREVGERLRHTIEARRWAGLPADRIVTASFGLALPPPFDLAGLMRHADMALYAAKRGGRNRLCEA